MKIIRREIPAHVIAENEHALAFLDLFPLAFGHVLVIPKIEVNAIYDVPEPYYSAVWAMVRQLAPAIQSAFPCRKVGTACPCSYGAHERSRGAFLCSSQVAPSSGGIAGTCCAYPGVFER
jgi:diadenosine tetraphosphate (Ap4A) HIT family hydrolase